MNRSQARILLLGAALLVAIFLFPYTRYLEVQESPGGPSRVSLEGLPAGAKVTSIRFQTREGFRPVWQSADPLSLDQGSGMFGLGIRWPVVLGLAAAVTAVAGAAMFLVRGDGSKQAGGG
jgi:hypothetical protein